MRTASAGGSEFWLRNRLTIDIARCIDVDRKRRLRLLAHDQQRVLNDRCKSLRAATRFSRSFSFTSRSSTRASRFFSNPSSWAFAPSLLVPFAERFSGSTNEA